MENVQKTRAEQKVQASFARRAELDPATWWAWPKKVAWQPIIFRVGLE